MDSHAATMSDRTWLRYSELSPEARAVAREWWREQQHETHGLKGLLRDELKAHFGVTGCEVQYSLGYCQGDGVAFYGQPDLETWAEKDEHLAGLMARYTLWCTAWGYDVDLSCCISPSEVGHYHHHNTMWVDVDNCNGYPASVDESGDHLVGDIADYLHERVKEISWALEKLGYDEIEYQRSDDAIHEDILANDEWCRFDEEGSNV